MSIACCYWDSGTCSKIMLLSLACVAVCAFAAGGEAKLPAAAATADAEDKAVVDSAGAAGTTALAPPTNPRVQKYLQSHPFAGAVSGSSGQKAEKDRPPVLLWGRVILYLALLGAIMICGLYTAKRFLPGSRQLFSCPGIEILGRTHLDPRRYIALVRVGRRVLVVGVGPDDMAQLSELTDNEEVAELLTTVKPKTDAGKNIFGQLFHKYLDKSEADAAQGEAAKITTELGSRLDELQDRVRMLRKNE